MKNVWRKPDCYNTFIQAAWGTARLKSHGWARFVRLWAGTQQIRALFNPLQTSSGRIPLWIQCSCPAVLKARCWCWNGSDISVDVVDPLGWGGRVETIAVLYPELWKGYNYSYPSAWVWAAAGKLLTDRFFSCLFWASNSQSSNSLMPIKGDVEFPLHLCEGDLQAEWNTVVEGLYLDVIYLAHEKCKKIELYWHHISCCWVKN